MSYLGKPRIFNAVIGFAPTAYRSESEFAAAILPYKSGLFTTGGKKSTDWTIAKSSFITKAPASSRPSELKIRPVCSNFGKSFRTSPRSFGLSFAAQPAQRTKEVSFGKLFTFSPPLGIIFIYKLYKEKNNNYKIYYRNHFDI
jgi:hypothetical protein